MNRRLFASLITLVAATPIAAVAKENGMSTTMLLEKVMATEARATELTVYHVDSYMTTRTPIAPSKLESYPDVEVHTIHDRTTIAHAYANFRASRPVPTAAPAEYRWKLVFSDATKHRLMEVYVAAFAEKGAIENTPISFENEALVTWLRKTYAPHEEHLTR